LHAAFLPAKNQAPRQPLCPQHPLQLSFVTMAAHLLSIAPHFIWHPLAAFVPPGEGFNATARGIRNGDLTIGSFTYVGTDSLYIYARAYDTALHAHIDGAMKYAVSSATAKDIVYLDMADTTGTYPIYLVMF